MTSAELTCWKALALIKVDKGCRTSFEGLHRSSTAVAVSAIILGPQGVSSRSNMSAVPRRSYDAGKLELIKKFVAVMHCSMSFAGRSRYSR